MEPSVAKAKTKRHFQANAFLLPTLLVVGMGGGMFAGFQVAQMLKPDAYQFVAGLDDYAPNVEAVLAKAAKAEKAGTPFDKALTVDEIIVASFARFDQSENCWSIGVGFTQAAMVKQGIQTRSVKMGERFFEESNASSSLINIHDRMFREGDVTTTYWGERDDYENHTKKTMSNDEYKTMMGRNVAESLVYLVSPATMLSGTPPSGDGESAIKEVNGQYVVEAELNPKTGVLRYQCQMQTISSLKYKPTFDYCHLTVTMDKDLTLRKLKSHEKYFATTSAGVGSSCEGTLVTEFHVGAPDFGFPEVGSKLPAYPESLE
jgi:hypothetical protein